MDCHSEMLILHRNACFIVLHHHMTEKFGSNLNTYIIAYRSEAKTVNMYDYVKTHIR